MDRFLFSRMATSSPNPMFDHSLESSHRDDFNKWSNIGIREEITQLESIKVNLTTLIWSSGSTVYSQNGSNDTQALIVYTTFNVKNIIPS